MVYPSRDMLMNPFPQVNGQFVFHYTTYTSALGILLSQQICLGSLTNMNDPLEFQDYREGSFDYCSNNKKDQPILLYSEYKNAVEEKERAVRLASFSIDEPIQKDCQEKCYNLLSKGWARSRMWAQYADNHKGLSLVFDREFLEIEFKGAFDTYESFCDKVKYTNNLKPLKNALSSPCKSFLEGDKIKFLFQKCQDFRDEQEFRLLLIKEDLKDDKEMVSFSIEKTLCGVIMGTKFPIENRRPLQKAIECCNPKIKLFSISWNYGMPEINNFA